MIKELKLSYGALFEDALINDIAQVGTFKNVPAGFKLMDIGAYVKGMPLLNTNRGEILFLIVIIIV